ncbi:heterokaryon incompatibility protein-domain-containing protein [Pyrenochaeta sp. MPI-SDFR-AT-0127]|nr:heterokaryon incompatibility protein-domain-containing protein [Pyrenochaeta sp. MPI-SDFR-AT-0127]
MLSQLCPECSQTLVTLLEGGGRLTRERLTLHPRTCHVCANLYATSSQHFKNPGVVSSASFEISSGPLPGTREVYVDCKEDGPSVSESFLVKPASDYPPRNVYKATPDTFSRSTWSFLRSKLNECLAMHTSCRHIPITNSSSQPTRLLNLRGRTRYQIKLVDMERDSKYSYFTLSHCWGGEPQMKLTRKTEQSLRAGIDSRTLPRTYRQAVEVCRQLDIEYLWIDSLCIFQDNLADWHTQATCMRDIYSYAVCNIAATGASDSTVGLQFDRNPLASVPFEIVVSEQSPSLTNVNSKTTNARYTILPSLRYNHDVTHGPLSKRAWVVQERFLSTRIMHFAVSGVYWECTTDLCSDIHPVSLPEVDEIFGEDYFKLKHMLSTTIDGKTLHSQRAWTDELYRAWSSLADKYSECELSFETDKLVALNGIVQKVAQLTGDFLICGLWKQYFIPQLLWRTSHVTIKHRSNSWLAPTWSWASNQTSFEHTTHLGCGKSREMVTIEHLSMEALPSGQIKHASLVLRGKLVNADLIRNNERYECSLICQPSGDMRKFHAELMEYDQSSPSRARVVCMAIYEDTCEEGLRKHFFDLECQLGILILQQCAPEPTPTYERIGVMFLPEEHCDFYISHESSEEHSIAII